MAKGKTPKHPAKAMVTKAAKDLRNAKKPKLEKEFAASIVSSAGKKNKKP
jgi:hypothetical protein